MAETQPRESLGRLLEAGVGAAGSAADSSRAALDQRSEPRESGWLLRPPVVSLVVSLFRSERYLHRFVRNVRRFAGEIRLFPWLSVEVILVLNSPSNLELRGVRGLADVESAQLGIRSVTVPRESLYASWNRGIALAQGDVLGFWNVDDARFGAAAAEAAVAVARGAQLVYFPYVNETRWHKWGFIPQARRIVVRAPEFERDVFKRTFLIGPFFMFSRALYGAVGPFDEQFHITGDLDWSLRAMEATPFTRCHLLAGVYLNEWRGLSMSGSERAVVEHNVIYSRHGLTDCLQPVSKSLLNQYDEDRIFVPEHSGSRP